MDIVDGTLQPPVSYPQTSQVLKSESHIQSTISNTVTDFDTSGYPQHWILNILLRHQLPMEEAEAQPVLLMDLQQPDPKARRVALDEFVSMWVILTHTHTETLTYTPETVPSISNPTFE